jgi:CRP-like cAMP-binding protein
VLPQIAKGGPEQQAIEAGEIDAVIDYASSNVILLPAARRALGEIAQRAAAANREAVHEAPIANSLLAALPHAEYLRLLPGLEPVTLKSGEVIQELGAPIAYAYFPVDCVISLLATVAGRQPLEVGLAGYEGMVGISLALGVDVSSVRAQVQASGTAMRMNAERFQQAFRQSTSLQRELYRYTHAKLAVARQTVACNRFHAVEARLARYLLMTSDRVRRGEFFLTQASLADAVGVRRGTVNAAAGFLQQWGLIGYRRGWIRILDRKGLERASCECYARIVR